MKFDSIQEISTSQKNEKGRVAETYTVKNFRYIYFNRKGN